jgi:hypothetical protein
MLSRLGSVKRIGSGLLSQTSTSSRWSFPDGTMFLTSKPRVMVPSEEIVHNPPYRLLLLFLFFSFAGFRSHVYRSDSTLSLLKKTAAPPMVYISGEEMTRYACQLIVDQWIKPYFDISKWEIYDLSCKARDDTDDAVLKDAVEAGSRIGAIFKEPTITPSALQVRCSISEYMSIYGEYASPLFLPN